MKKSVLIAIGCISITLAGCRAAQNAEVDSLQESEPTAVETEEADDSENGSDWAGNNHRSGKIRDKRNTESEDIKITDDIENPESENNDLSNRSEIDSETEELLYAYYKQYNPLLGDENSELLQLDMVSYGDVRLDYAYIHSDCYEKLSENLADYDSGTYDTENLYSDWCVHRADQELLSYVKRKISGGAATEYISHTFDVASGRELLLEDVAADMDSLMEAVAKQAGNEIAEPDLEAWTVGYEGLTVYLRTNTEEAMPVYIPYEQYPDLFEERVKHVPTRYAVGFNQYNDLIMDANRDGIPDVIRMELVYGIPDVDKNKTDDGILGLDGENDGRVTDIVVKIGEFEISCPAGYWAFDHDCGGYYIQNDNGQNYIYVYAKGLLDREYTYNVIRLDKEGPVYVGDDEHDFSSSRILTDPQRVKLERECCWGTSGFHMYNPFGGIPQDNCLGYVDAEGYLTRDEDIIYFYCGEIFTATEEAEGESVNADGTLAGDTVTISEGEYVILLRTDISETYADYIRIDGSICRVEKEW